MTNQEIETPVGYTAEHSEYLEELRESGETNMFGASPYLQREFGLEKSQAREYLSYWMKTYGQGK